MTDRNDLAEMVGPVCDAAPLIFGGVPADAVPAGRAAG